MNFLFVMDPLETVNVFKDTSFIFMVGAARRGHKVYYVPSGGISLDRGRVLFDCLPVTPREGDQEKPFDRGQWTRVSDEQIAAARQSLTAAGWRADPTGAAAYAGWRARPELQAEESVVIVTSREEGEDSTNP